MKRLLWLCTLASTLLLAAPLTVRAGEPQHAYVGIKKCKTCHEKELYGDQVSAWREGKHSKAYQSLGSTKASEYAQRLGIEGSPQEAGDCLECHVTAQGVDGRFIKYELDREDGVQCESCHGPGADYRKRSIMSNRDEVRANGLVSQSEAVCVTCHNDKSPAWNSKRYTRADGSPSGFDYEQAKEAIAHPIPEERRGKIAELEKELKAKKKQQR